MFVQGVRLASVLRWSHEGTRYPIEPGMFRQMEDGIRLEKWLPSQSSS